ncbi:MAG: F0F1 ATP synthase subunit epsilon [Pseudomonadota bacterium]
MAITMHLDIVSAEQEIYSGRVNMVVAPAEEGDIGIMPRHSPLITRMKPGEVKVVIDDNEDQFFYVSGGILEIQPHVVTVLSDTAMRAKDLDEERVLEMKRQAEAALTDKRTEFEEAKALAELAQVVVQLRMLEKRRIRRG